MFTPVYVKQNGGAHNQQPSFLNGGLPHSGTMDISDAYGKTATVEYFAKHHDAFKNECSLLRTSNFSFMDCLEQMKYKFECVKYLLPDTTVLTVFSL